MCVCEVTEVKRGQQTVCISFIFTHSIRQPQLPRSQNSVPLPLKLEYINKSCLHINSCWCTHSNLLKYTLIYKDTYNVCFFSKSMYELRLVFFSLLSQCPSLSTDVKPLHNQAGVNSGRERGQSICSCLLFTMWMTEVIWIEINKTTKGCFFFFF